MQPDPISLWNHGLSESAGLLQRYPEHSIRMDLLPEGEATITEKGFLFKGCLYSCKKARAAEWFSLARADGADSIKVSYRSGLVDTIYIHTGDRNDSIWEAELTEKSIRYKGDSFSVVAYYIERAKLTWPDIEQTQRQLANDFNERNETIKNNAKAAAAQFPRKSRSSRRKDTQAARSVALQTERSERVEHLSGSGLATSQEQQTVTKPHEQNVAVPGISRDPAALRRQRMLDEF